MIAASAATAHKTTATAMLATIAGTMIAYRNSISYICPKT